MKIQKSDKILAVIFIGIIIVFFISILIKFGVKEFKGVDVETSESQNQTATSDMQEDYPFYDEDGNVITVDKSLDGQEESTQIVLGNKCFGNALDKINSIKQNVEGFSTKQIFGYSQLTEAAKKYESLIQFNFASMSEYNPVVKMKDGYLTSYIAKTDVTAFANSVAEFSKACQKDDRDFLYVEIPYKISKYTDTDISGTVDFSNQNADDFLDMLKSAGVDTYDIREEIYVQNLSHHELFFRTDHHWTGETGLWASQNILECLNQKYGYDLPTNNLNTDLFTKTVYEKWFLGSQGKKIMLSQTEPDDIALLYPTYETLLNYRIPYANIDTAGDFSVTYDMSQIEEKDYYNKNPFLTYNHGEQPLCQIENQIEKNDVKILIIHESNAEVVTPFLALCCEYVDAIDLRHFTGSLKTYIEQTDPDIVIVAYNPAVLDTVNDANYHSRMFDFR